MTLTTAERDRGVRNVSAADRVAILETYLPAGRLQNPPAPVSAESSGTSSGEWDWFYLLNSGLRRFIRRNLCGGELAIDDAAALAGFDYVDAFADALVVACRAARDLPDAELFDAALSVTLDDLVGPDEICDLLGVERNTLVQWRRRAHVAFPLPLLELSKMPVWSLADVELWAFDTGRLAQSEPETF